MLKNCVAFQDVVCFVGGDDIGFLHQMILFRIRLVDFEDLVNILFQADFCVLAEKSSSVVYRTLQLGLCRKVVIP